MYKDGTPTQRRWQNIARDVRNQLRAQIPQMAELVPEDLAAFVEALHAACTLEAEASTFDARVDGTRNSND
jgi:hypothetical protein